MATTPDATDAKENRVRVEAERGSRPMSGHWIARHFQSIPVCPLRAVHSQRLRATLVVIIAVSCRAPSGASLAGCGDEQSKTRESMR
jgi:hypothetical protein